MDIMDDVLDLIDSLGDTVEKGKRGAKRMLRGEGGFSTLVVVLVILALGSIIITPLLVFVVTGQRAGRTHNEITDRLYAADTGIQDGLWRVQNDELPAWMQGPWTDPAVYDNPYSYWLPDQVNGCGVEVTLRAVWLLEGLESAKNGKQPHGEWVIVSNVMSSGRYKIVLMDNGINGEYKIERIGVWLPAGFTYTAGSSNVEKLDPSDPAYLVPTVSEWKNGHTVVWDYAASPKKNVLYTDLPAETATRRIITFDYTPGGPMANAFSWARTNRNDIYLSWSGEVKQFQLEATATDAETGRSTTVIAGNMQNTSVTSGMAVNGDYVVTGNALIRNADDHELYRERLYKETPAPLTGVPDSGIARKILVYWTGWKKAPFNVWYENITDPNKWSAADRDQLYNLVPNYKLDKVSLTVDLGADGIYFFPLVQADSWQVVPNAQNALDQDPWDDPNGWTYSCSVDVTDLVKSRLLEADVPAGAYDRFNGEAIYTVGHAEGATAVQLDRVMQGIWGSSASDVYLVGNSGTIVHFDGGEWRTIAVGTTIKDLKSVWGSSSTDIWTVGDRRGVGGGDYRYTILHGTVTDNGTYSWVDLSVANGQNLKSIWGSSSSSIWTVGESWSSKGSSYYTILNGTSTDNGATYSWANTAAVGTTTPRTLYGIWGSGDNWTAGDRVYAVGASGTILCYDGSTWSPMTSPTTSTLRGVWGATSGDVYAVGSGGTILHYNGANWAAVETSHKPSGFSTDLYGVWGTGTDFAAGDVVFAVGASGAVLRCSDGINWAAVNTASTRYLYGAWGAAPLSVYAVGESVTNVGTLLYYDGADDNGDGSLWDPVTGGTKLYTWTANHSGETASAATDYPLGDPALNTSGDNPNYQASNASWSILVIYTSPETKGHQLYFYDTLRNSGRYETRDFKIQGFLAPASVLTEDDAAKITCFVGEGDSQIEGDNIYLNSSCLNNGASGTWNAADNVWNSISNATTALEGDPDGGIDLDTFYVSGKSGIIQPSDSEATFTMETEMDVWSMVYVILSLRSDLSGSGILSYIVE